MSKLELSKACVNGCGKEMQLRFDSGNKHTHTHTHTYSRRIGSQAATEVSLRRDGTGCGYWLMCQMGSLLLVNLGRGVSPFQ